MIAKYFGVGLGSGLIIEFVSVRDGLIRAFFGQLEVSHSGRL